MGELCCCDGMGPAVLWRRYWSPMLLRRGELEFSLLVGHACRIVPPLFWNCLVGEEETVVIGEWSLRGSVLEPCRTPDCLEKLFIRY